MASESTEPRLGTTPVLNTKDSDGSAGIKVLLVDDSPDNMFLMQRYLQIARIAFESATNGQEALDKALAGDFSIILMDVQMPIMDGIEATKKLRLAGYQKAIIALTAHSQREVESQCRNCGFTDYLSKPVDRARLMAVLHQHSQPIEVMHS